MRDFALVLATVGRTLELNRLFDTLAAQSYRDFEVIVVDQNQDDRLLPILHRARYLGLVLRHLRHSPPNLALARNAGIAAADARWIGFPDDDCWYQPQTLARIALRSRRFDHPHGIVTRWVEQDPAHPPATLSWARSSRFRDLPVSSITLFFQRDLLERIGGFDGRLGVGQWFGAGEETDLVLRALRAGARVVYEPGAQIHHRVDTAHSGRSGMRRTATSRARGTGAMYAKHRLPMWVIARGLVSPIIKPLSRGHLGAELAHGLAIAQGRWQGWLHWWSQHGADQTTSLPDSMMLRG
jgi:GT2 family glycosyltransferase